MRQSANDFERPGPPLADQAGQTQSACATEDGADRPGEPIESFEQAGQWVREAGDYFRLFLTAKRDGLALAIRRALVLVVASIVALLVAAAALITAVAYMISGLAGAVGAMFEPDRPWAGQLIIGSAILGGAALFAWLVLRRISRRSMEQTVQRYERAHNQHRVAFGRDD